LSGSLKNLCFDLSYQVINSELIELFNWQSVLWPWRSHKEIDVLIFLELGGEISSNFSVFFEGKILRTILACETVDESFILSSKIILKLFEVSGKIVVSAKMSDQDGIIALNRRSLFLKAEVGIKVIDDPSAVDGYVLSCK